MSPDLVGRKSKCRMSFTEANLPCADTLLDLAIQLLALKSAAVTLLDGNREVLFVAKGFLSPGAASQPLRSCKWLLVPPSDKMVIVEDTLRDTRQAIPLTCPTGIHIAG